MSKGHGKMDPEPNCLAKCQQIVTQLEITFCSKKGFKAGRSEKWEMFTEQ